MIWRLTMCGLQFWGNWLRLSVGAFPASLRVKLQFVPEAGSGFFQAYDWQVREFRFIRQAAHYLNREILLDGLVWRLPDFKKDGALFQWT